MVAAYHYGYYNVSESSTWQAVEWIKNNTCYANTHYPRLLHEVHSGTGCG
jgi:hypothetical protein